ncbi:MAG TPA: hypothetical protein VEA58_11520, partial [Anaerovoracaceae bacterium]|nr:hypothetical protein [Anaerovoracaceae bacterium]
PNTRKATIDFVTQNGKAIIAGINETGLFFAVVVALAMESQAKQAEIAASTPFNVDTFLGGLKTTYATPAITTTKTPEGQLTAIAQAGYTKEDTKVFVAHLKPILKNVTDVYKFGKVSKTRPTRNLNDQVKKMGKKAVEIKERTKGKSAGSEAVDHAAKKNETALGKIASTGKEVFTNAANKINSAFAKGEPHGKPTA